MYIEGHGGHNMNHFSAPSPPPGITPMLQLIRRISADPSDITKCSLVFANQVVVNIFWVIPVKMHLVRDTVLEQHLLTLVRRRRTSFWGRSWRRWRRTIRASWTSGSRWINLHRVNLHNGKNLENILADPNYSECVVVFSLLELQTHSNDLWLRGSGSSSCGTPQWLSPPLLLGFPAITSCFHRCI